MSTFELDDTSTTLPRTSNALNAEDKEVLAFVADVFDDFGGLAIDGETTDRLTRRAGRRCLYPSCVCKMTF